MKAQAQFTIHSLNDVIASTTAPSSPYKGQLWVNTSYSPPRTFVYNGSAWKEQNGTDTLRSNVSTLTTKANNLQSNLDGLTSEVSVLTQEVDNNTSNITTLTASVSTLQQTATEISAEVSMKADKTCGDSSSSFGWSLTSSGFYLYSNATTVMSVTSSGLTITGSITAQSGTIGGFTIGTSAIYKTKTSYSSSTAGVYLGTNGIGLGAATFYVSSAGRMVSKSGTIGAWNITSSYLYSSETGGSFYMASASNANDYWIRAHDAASGGGNMTFSVSKTGVLSATGANISGTITATAGSLQDMTITGKLTFGGNSTYYIDANNDNAAFYIYLPKFRVDDSGAVFSGSLSAPSGTIGGFTIGTTKIYKTKTSYSSATAGVYIGTDGIGLGAGTFYVTSAGKLYATNATITGTITSSNVNITGGSLKIPTSGNGYASIDFSGVGVSDISDDWTSGSAIKLETNAIKYEGTKSSGGGYSHQCIIITHEETTVYKRLMGNWYLGNSSNYLSTTTMSSTTCGYLYGTYVISSGLWIGTSTAGYQIKMDSDQIMFYYNSTIRGELECYSTYVDIQGTFKTNGGAWISSSDIKVKNSISDFSDAYSILFDNLKPRTYKYNDGTSSRIHSGFVVQEIVTAIKAAGLTTQDFAAVCAFGDPEEEATEWGLRYEEIISLNTWEIQKLKAEVKSLKKMIGGIV